jgi:phosphoglycerate kinase
MSLFLKLKDLDFSGKKVFLRADLNVPIAGGQIKNDFRLRSILPTLKFLLDRGGKVLIGTHLGRPKGKGIEPELSAKILVNWFNSHGYLCDLAGTIEEARQKILSGHKSLVMLENLRFFSGEKNKDLTFAQNLSQGFDFYVNDAFGLVHRDDTSVYLLPKQFDKNLRAIGCLMEREISTLEKIRRDMNSKLVIIIGGSKVEDKVCMLEKFICRVPKSVAILLGGALSLAFIKAGGYCSGAAVFDVQTLEAANYLVDLAKNKKVTLVIPKDYLGCDTQVRSAPKVFSLENIPDNITCGDIGPETIKLYKNYISQGELIFCNGPMGIYEQEEFSLGTKEILLALSKTSGFSVVGGGDTVSAVYNFGFEDKINFISTGGGATVDFLGCDDPYKDLPALGALIE